MKTVRDATYSSRTIAVEFRPLYVATVVAADGVRFTAMAAERERLRDALAAYVSTHASQQLWEADAEAARLALSRGEQQAAIDLYFAAVGDRWDAEWLVTSELPQP